MELPSSQELFHQFGALKGWGVLGVFAFCTLIQILSPHHKDLRGDFRNWLVNMPLAAINSFVVNLIGASSILALALWVETKQMGLFNALELPLVAQAVVTVFLLDLVSYFWHRLNHEVRFFWRFHAAHHSDVNFDTSTAFRFHTVELLLSMGLRAMVIASFGIPILGILVFEVIYHFFNTFEHGNIRLPVWLERVWEKVFITPALHRKHHSVKPNEYNSNYGTIFSFWDRIFRSLRASDSSEQFPVGIPTYHGPQRWWAILAQPFRY